MGALIIVAAALGYILCWLLTTWLVAPSVAGCWRSNLDADDYAGVAFMCLGWPIFLFLVPFWAAGHLLKAVSR